MQRFRHAIAALSPRSPAAYARAAMATAAAPTTALERWSALVRARREQMDAQLAALGGPPQDWWAQRAESFTRGVGDPAAAPPFGAPEIIERLARTDTVIDIGGGAGRYALPISRAVAHVTLIEPSPAMAERARALFEAAGRDNLTVIERGWPGVRVATASAVLIANVLAQIEDLAGFLRPALGRARDWLFIVHGGHAGDGGEATARVIERHHGEPRVPNPGLAELIPALHELGILPDVRMGTRRFQRSYADAGEAARAVAANALVEPTPAALRNIRSMLRRRLRRTDDGRLAEPPLDLPVGLLTWPIRRA